MAPKQSSHFTLDFPDIQPAKSIQWKARSVQLVHQFVESFA